MVEVPHWEMSICCTCLTQQTAGAKRLGGGWCCGTVMHLLAVYAKSLVFCMQMHCCTTSCLPPSLLPPSPSPSFHVGCRTHM